MTDVATMVMEEWQSLSSRDWLPSALWKKYVNQVLHPLTMTCHSAVWNSRVEMMLEINLYELIA
jgi:hypothetical protein